MSNQKRAAQSRGHPHHLLRPHRVVYLARGIGLTWLLFIQYLLPVLTSEHKHLSYTDDRLTPAELL